MVLVLPKNARFKRKQPAEKNILSRLEEANSFFYFENLNQLSDVKQQLGDFSVQLTGGIFRRRSR